MSDTDPAPAASAPRSPAEYVALLSAHEAVDASVRGTNRTALFASLAAAGITHVVVFDGYGDSGQIESVEARKGDERVDLPAMTVAGLAAEWGKPDPVPRDLPVAELIENLAYDYLAQTHGGWENNDGAVGEFVFDVAAAKITLDYDERYTATNNYTHEF